MSSGLVTPAQELSKTTQRNKRRRETKRFWKQLNAETQRTAPEEAEKQLPPTITSRYKRTNPSGPLPEGVHKGVELEVYFKDPTGNPGFFHRGTVVDTSGCDGRVSIKFHDGDHGRFDLREGSLERWRWPMVESIHAERRAREQAAADIAEQQIERRLSEEHAARMASYLDNDALREQNAVLRRSAAIRDGAVRAVDAHPQGGHLVIMASGCGLCAPHDLEEQKVVQRWVAWVEEQVGTRRGQPSALYAQWKAGVPQLATVRAPCLAASNAASHVRRVSQHRTQHAFSHLRPVHPSLPHPLEVRAV